MQAICPSEELDYNHIMSSSINFGVLFNSSPDPDLSKNIECPFLTDSRCRACERGYGTAEVVVGWGACGNQR